MNGILHILDQAGLGLIQLQQENESLKRRVAELEQALAVARAEEIDLEPHLVTGGPRGDL